VELRKALSGLEGLLEIMGREVTAKGVRAGTHSKGWTERIPDCGMGAKRSADIRDGEQIGI